MARGDPTYAHIDVTWPDDPRSVMLTANQNWLYEVAVLTAVAARRNVLPRTVTPSFLCRRATVKVPTWKALIATALSADPEKPIIWVREDGRICIPSIGKRHAKLEWKDERVGPFPAPYGADTGPKTSPPPSLRPSKRAKALDVKRERDKRPQPNLENPPQNPNSIGAIVSGIVAEKLGQA